jgi:hypothetical protein
VVPKLEAIYTDSASMLTVKAQKITDRAIKKGTVGGHVGMQLLFEPAMLLGLVSGTRTSTMYQLADVAHTIPFAGDYTSWAPARATIAASVRHLTKEEAAEFDTVRSWLSLPENGNQPGPPVITDAVRNRLNGNRLREFRADYLPPLKLAQFSYVIGKLRELGVMWAFGGSELWPRPRIDDEINSVREQLSEFVAGP